MKDSTSRRLAEYALGVADRDLPQLARQRAVDAITDCVGCMLAGALEPIAGAVAGAIAVGHGGSLLAGGARCAPPADAALFNGALAHALDYDDTNHPAYAHPSAVLVPAMLALAPIVPLGGRELVTAYVLGFEVFGKLGRALNTAHYRRGWHATATFGTIAACVAAGRLLRLDPPRLTAALGIAASTAGGLRANFGTMVKPLHAGCAARNGVLAALLARAGLDASEAAFDHDYGFLRLFAGEAPADPAPLARWGEPLEILTPHGLALKPYPSCGATHTAIEAALAIHAELAGAPIEAVRAGVSELAFAPLIHVMPDRPLAGKFSLHFCVAAALLDGELTLATFTQPRIDDPQVRALIERTTMVSDPRVGDGAEFPTVLEVRAVDGRRLERFVPLAQGKPERWFPPARIRAKFDDCTRAFDGAGAVFDALRALDADAPVDGAAHTLLGALRAVRSRVDRPASPGSQPNHG